MTSVTPPPVSSSSPFGRTASVPEEEQQFAPPGQVPIPLLETPVGTLEFDGHEIHVWSLACTPAGEAICLNCDAADASVSATLKHLLRRRGGSAIFTPAEGCAWDGPTEITKLADHYTLLIQALNRKGLRLKNQCALPECASVYAGLARPGEVTASHSTPTSEEESEEEGASAASSVIEEVQVDSKVEHARFVLGDSRVQRPPKGAFFAHLLALTVVCHEDWEDMLWRKGVERDLLTPMHSLGMNAWRINGVLSKWNDLVEEGWLAGWFSRPLTTSSSAPSGKRNRKARRSRLR